ncbi:MAG: DUF1540 domain-containing protein, partial [Clostridia bacterium]|nr:DUF1540 domain-containing protein [Clostridia bacterium]
RMIILTDCKTEQCINCTVKNCTYHTENNKCGAGKIEVGNSTAKSHSETCCDTFKCRENC